MRERVRQLKGTFEFESAPGRGTTITAEVPFRPAS
jgi:signal transduction histidine kinase